MLEYDRLDISEGIDVDKTNRSKKCILCHYWYSLNKSFTYGPYLCDGGYNIVQKSTNLLLMLKNVYIEFIFLV